MTFSFLIGLFISLFIFCFNVSNHNPAHIVEYSRKAETNQVHSFRQIVVTRSDTTADEETLPDRRNYNSSMHFR